MDGHRHGPSSPALRRAALTAPAAAGPPLRPAGFYAPLTERPGGSGSTPSAPCPGKNAAARREPGPGFVRAVRGLRGARDVRALRSLRAVEGCEGKVGSEGWEGYEGNEGSEACEGSERSEGNGGV